MNDQALATPAGDQERPLVTFILIAYNQEKYIREAVEGAFSQTYSPLEIILSDDRSTDRTFDIMQEMAENYTGPHQVRLNRNTANRGIVRHVFFVASMSSAPYIVVAAGDDVSKPSRTAELIRMFDQPEVWGVSSGYDVIDEHGVVLRSGCLAPETNKMASYFRLEDGKKYVVLQGSTAAYRKEIFFDLKDMETGYAEDNFLNFLIYANGGVAAQTASSLVSYRQHSDAVHHRIETVTEPQDSEKASYADSQAGIRKLQAFQAILDSASASDLVNRQALEQDMRQWRIVSDWPKWSLFKRLHSISQEMLFQNSGFLKWQIARLFGKFPNYQPKIFLEEFLGKTMSKNGKP